LQYETIGDSSALWYFYDADGNPSGIRYKNGDSINDYYFVCNWRGDVIQIYNAAGELVATYDYDAWGRVTENATLADTQNIAEINPIRYRGYYYDSETGLYYVNSRYYDPAVKRFVNSDDSSIVLDDQGKISQYNLFAYCFNNPANMEDKDGEAAANIIGGIVGGVARAALGVLLAKRLGLTGWKKWALISAATVGGAALGAFLGPYAAKIGGKLLALAKSSFRATISAGKTAIRHSKKIAQLIKNAGKLKMTRTVMSHLSSRPYINSTLLIQNIMRAAMPIADKSMKYGLKWVVKGTYNGKSGVWELVINTATNTIVHFLFRSK